MPGLPFSPELTEAISEARDQAKAYAEGMHKKASEALVKLNNRLAVIEELDPSNEENFRLVHEQITTLDGNIAKAEALIRDSLVASAPTHELLYQALAKAQGEITAAEATQTVEVRKNNKFLYSFKYADLAACLEVIRKPLSDNGLALIQIPSLLEGNVVQIQTILGHESGQSIECTMTMVPEKEGPQAIGTCMSYLRRYSLSAMIGVAQFDDDAQTATRTAEDEPRLSPEQIDEVLGLAETLFGAKSDVVIKRMLGTAFEGCTAVGQIRGDLYEQVINLLNNQATREKKAANKKPPKGKAGDKGEPEVSKLDTTKGKEEPGADG